MSADVDAMFEHLKVLEHQDPKFDAIIKEITQNFDDFPDEPLPGAHEGRIGRTSRVGTAKRDAKFLGYTYTKPKMKQTHELVESVVNEGVKSMKTSPTSTPKSPKSAPADLGVENSIGSSSSSSSSSSLAPAPAQPQAQPPPAP